MSALLSVLLDYNQKSHFQVYNENKKLLFYIVEKKNFFKRLFGLTAFNCTILTPDKEELFNFSRPFSIFGSEMEVVSTQTGKKTGSVEVPSTGWIKIFDKDHKEIGMFERKVRVNYEITTDEKDDVSVIVNGGGLADDDDFSFFVAIGRMYGIKFRDHPWTPLEKFLIISSAVFLDFELYES